MSFFTSMSNMVHQAFNTDEKISLKDSYQGFLFFVILNFILGMFWAINPFDWKGLASIFFDGLMIIYAIFMMIVMTTTLIRRFKDASVSPYQAFIFPLMMTVIYVIIRLRMWNQTRIIVLLILYFLSHFYLVMLAMMPSTSHDDKGL